MDLQKHRSFDHTGIRHMVNIGEFLRTGNGCVGRIFPEEATMSQTNKH